MPRRKRHRNSTECQRHVIRIFKTWHLGLSTCNRWCLRSAASKPAATEEATQWAMFTCWGEESTRSERFLVDSLQNNANEGPVFTPQNIITEDDFVDFLRNTFPLFTEDDISRILLYYPSTNASVDISTPEFATSGNSTPTALNESIFATGQQQRANVSRISPRILSDNELASANYDKTDTLSESLRRNDFCLPRLLARRGLHEQQPCSIQVPVLCRRRLARNRPDIHLWSSDAQSSV